MFFGDKPEIRGVQFPDNSFRKDGALSDCTDGEGATGL